MTVPTTQLYDVGDQVGLEITFYNVVGAATDPTVVTFHLTRPDGTTLAYTYGPDPELTRIGQGHYAVEYLATAPGVYDYGFKGTGNLNVSEESQFFVRDVLVAVTLAKGYTTPAKVGQHLGRTLDGAQSIQVEAVIRAVEAWIDRKFGRAWNGASPSSETHVALGGRVWLNNYPVTAITQIRVHWTPLDDWRTLTVDEYQLVSTATGEVYLSVADGYTVEVTYTHSGPVVPADVQLAATMIVGRWAQPSIGGYDGTVKGYSVGGEESVQFATDQGGKPITIPPEAYTILDAIPHRRFA